MILFAAQDSQTTINTWPVMGPNEGSNDFIKKKLDKSYKDHHATKSGYYLLVQQYTTYQWLSFHPYVLYVIVGHISGNT